MAHFNNPYEPERQRAPPPMIYPPQPVEMDPSFPRFSKAWDSFVSPLQAGPLEQNGALNRHLRFVKQPPSSLGFPFFSSAAPHGHPSLSAATPHGHPSPSAATPHGHPFDSWYSNIDAPWIPKDALVEVSPVNPRLQPGRYPFGHPSIGNRNLRSRGLPIESASVDGSTVLPKTQSDSGYGSIPSMDTSSIRSYEAENRATESRSFYYQIDAQSGRDMREMEAAPARIPLAGPTALSCPTCHIVVRTPSELKKHDMRHKRPFVCGHSNCPRSLTGFGTKNDLDRHIRSKHPQDRLDGPPGQVHLCVLGVCQAKSRKFPRLDNYRNHLKRIHYLGDDEVECIVRRSVAAWSADKCAELTTRLRNKEQQPAPGQGNQLGERVYEDSPDFRAQDDIPDTHLESSHAIWSDKPLVVDRPPELYELANIVSPESEGKASRVGSIGELSAVLSPLVEGPSPGIELGPKLDLVDLPSPALDTSGRPTEVGTTTESTPLRISKAGPKGSPEAGAREVLATALAEARAVKMLTSLAKSRAKSIDGIEDPKRANQSEILSKSFVDWLFPVPQGSDSRDRIAHIQGEDSHEESMDNENATAILQAIQNLGYELKKNNHAAPGTTDSQDSTGKTTIACPKCDKFRGRRCEMKKHMKRHDRPYGCTVAHCQKTFGSKNDWKRHENSQHFRYEAWRCAMHAANGGGVVCAKVVYHLDSFKAHLQKAHGVAEAELARQAASARRCAEADFPRDFWCGFCEREVVVGAGGEAWTERFNHIDDHFMGRRGQACRSILEWQQRPGTQVGRVEGRGEDVPVVSDYSASSGVCTSTSSPTSSSSASNSTPSDNSLASPPRPAKRGASAEPASPPQRARRRTSSEDGGKRWKRIFCCECECDYNPKTSTECDVDGHRFCGNCVVRRVRVLGGA